MQRRRTRHIVKREDIAQAVPRMWTQILQVSMAHWEQTMLQDLLPRTDPDAAVAALEWSIARNMVEFACIHPMAHRAVERMVPEMSQRWLRSCFPEGNPKGMLPPPLPSCPDRRMTWSDVRQTLEDQQLTHEDAAVLLRCFGKPSLGTRESLLRRLEWIVPPRNCAWHPWVKESLWRLARKPICASVAKRMFHVVDRDLQKLVPRCVENPHYRAGPPMRLYELAEVARIAANRPRRAHAAAVST